MEQIKLGLYALDSTELSYRNTIYIENLVSLLNTVKPLYNTDYKDIGDALELEAIYSSEIEGYFTTRRELSKFIQGSREPKTKDERAVYSNYLALQHGMANKSNLLSKEFILELNSLITGENVNDYRIEQVDIVNKRGDIVHEGLPFTDLDDYMNSLIRFAETSELDPLITSCILHFYFVYIHPFVDGNGRTGRAYSYLYLIFKGLNNYNLFSISFMLPEKRTQYYKQLKNIETNGYDLTNFIEFMLNIMIDGLIDIEHKYNLVNIINNVKQIYKMFKLNYTDLTETLLNYIYIRNVDFNRSKFYKKFRSKFIRNGYTDEQLKEEIDFTIEVLIKHNIVDSNWNINDTLKDRMD